MLFIDYKLFLCYNKSMKHQILDIFVPLRGKSASTHKNKKQFEQDFKATDKYKPYKTITGSLSLIVVFHFIGEYKGDLDNLLKNLFDALQRDNFIKNDNQIKSLSASIIENSFIEGISIKIRQS